MSATGLEVQRELGWSDRHHASHALRAVLHALRDRLPVNAAANLAAQFPILIRGLFYEGWQPERVPVRERSQDEFLTHVTEAFLFDIQADSRRIASAVFEVLSRHISPGEIEKVKNSLPAGIRELWP